MASVALDTAGDVSEPFRFFGTVQTFSPGSEEVLHSDSQMQKYALSLVDAADDQRLLTRVKECTGALWESAIFELGAGGSQIPTPKPPVRDGRCVWICKCHRRLTYFQAKYSFLPHHDCLCRV